MLYYHLTRRQLLVGTLSFLVGLGLMVLLAPDDITSRGVDVAFTLYVVFIFVSTWVFGTRRPWRTLWHQVTDAVRPYDYARDKADADEHTTDDTPG